MKQISKEMFNSLFVSRAVTARVLGINVRTLDRRVKQGDIPSILLGGKRLFSKDVIFEITEAARD